MLVDQSGLRDFGRPSRQRRPHTSSTPRAGTVLRAFCRRRSLRIFAGRRRRHDMGRRNTRIYGRNAVISALPSRIPPIIEQVRRSFGFTRRPVCRFCASPCAIAKGLIDGEHAAAYSSPNSADSTSTQSRPSNTTQFRACYLSLTPGRGEQ